MARPFIYLEDLVLSVLINRLVSSLCVNFIHVLSQTVHTQAIGLDFPS